MNSETNSSIVNDFEKEHVHEEMTVLNTGANQNKEGEKVLEHELYGLYGSVNAIYHLVHENHNKVEAIHVANLLLPIKRKLWRIAETVSHD